MKPCFFCGPYEGDTLSHQASESHRTMVELVASLDRPFWPVNAEIEPLVESE